MEESARDIYQKFHSRPEGLSEAEVSERRQKSGPNVLPAKKEFSRLRLLFSQFKSPLIFILLLAAALSAFLKEAADAVVIGVAVLVNTVIGFFQEVKAEESLLRLSKMVKRECLVIRGEERAAVGVEEVVAGDVLVLSLGDKVAADAVLVEAADLKISEAVLTGESAAVEKRVKDRVFMGTEVVSGRGRAVAAATGAKTEFGKIARLLKETVETPTPLQKQLSHLGRVLSVVLVAACFVLLGAGLFEGRPFLEMFNTAVAVAVAAVPEGLPLALTVILALGMQKMASRKALVRKLLAAETLGSTTVICVDKTGTLTAGRLKVVRWSPLAEASGDQELVAAAVLCNDLSNPVDIALWDRVREEGFDPQRIFDSCERLAEVPFSSKRKFMAVGVREGLGVADSPAAKLAGASAPRWAIYAKGAPELILSWCKMGVEERGEWEKLTKDWAKEGLRILALAGKEVQGSRFQVQGGLRAELGLGFTFLGLIGFSDPPRPKVKESLAACRRAGIKVAVITGDYRATAEAVLRRLGLEVAPEEVMEGRELERLSDEELAARIGRVKLFARTTPAQKHRIVEALQDRGEVVAMTGDGVNDAPALKKANIGVVVGEATEVAKETADMVLLDSNFKTIVEAVKEGRVIFANMRKVVTFLLSGSFTELILISGSLLLGLPLPLLPVQILWINLVEDGLPNFALAFEEAEEGVMEEKPRSKKAPLLDAEMKVIIFAVGLLTDLLLLFLFLWLLRRGLPLGEIRSFIFIGLGIDSLFYIFACRSLKETVFKMNPFSNRFLTGSVAAGFLMLVLALHLPPLRGLLGTYPLAAWEWGMLLGLGFLNLLAIEAVKGVWSRTRRV